MRLRQVALASRRLDEVARGFSEAFRLNVAYRDPHIDAYGLRNVVMPAGAAFIEVVEPIRDDASAGRFLDRAGGDAGYMLIFQVRDAMASAARATAEGARVVATINLPGYVAHHFHPKDFGGVLVSVDQQRAGGGLDDAEGDWFPAGPDWRAAQSDQTRDIVSVTVACQNPEALAARWATLLDLGNRAETPTTLRLDRGEIVFTASGERTGIVAMTLKSADPDRAMRRAREIGLPESEGGVLVGGVVVRAVA